MALRMGASVAGTIRSHVKDDRLSQMLDHFTQYVGSNPYGSPAVLCSIAHMQVAEGVWYPMGGTRAVAEGLAKLMTDLGGRLRPSTDIVGLEIENKRVTGVRTDAGEVERFDKVVSNMDSIRTYRELVGGDVGVRYDKKGFEPACSGVVLYLGLNKRYEHLAHHDFVFSRDPEEEFEYIYDKGEPAPDPTAYLAAPSGTDPSVAPEGGEALYVLVHTPYLRPHHDWSKMFAPYRAKIIDKLKRTGGMPDIEERIVVERHLTPQDIHDRYKGAQRGDLRPCEPRQVPRRIQAGQSLARHPGPLPRRRRGPSGPGHADGDDVGLDRPRTRSTRTPAAAASRRRPEGDGGRRRHAAAPRRSAAPAAAGLLRMVREPRSPSL